jgi:hypothetical protein
MQDLEGGLSDNRRWQGKEQTDRNTNTPQMKTSIVEGFYPTRIPWRQGKSGTAQKDEAAHLSVDQ